MGTLQPGTVERRRAGECEQTHLLLSTMAGVMRLARSLDTTKPYVSALALSVKAAATLRTGRRPW
jgi:hypothetical protein